MRSVPKRRSRSAVAREYGYPWPWQIEELVEEHAVERGVPLEELARRWGCNRKHLENWLRRHGFREENGRVER